MKYCFPAQVLFPSPPLTASMQGRIFRRIGQFAEDKIAVKYQAFTGRSQWYPVPIDAADFRDGSQGLNSKTIYYSFIVEKNPTVDKAKLEKLMNDRAIKGEDGQLVYIPDFMSEKAPAAKRFYEVKPGLPDQDNHSGETKIASVHALMHDLELPYAPGDLFKPTGYHLLFDQIVFIPPTIFPLPVKVSLEYSRHDRIKGLVVYRFCIDANFKKALALSLIIAIAAAIILALLFPDLLKDIPLPKIPKIPKIPELPAPLPSPFPRQPRPVPVPVPVPASVLVPVSARAPVPAAFDELKSVFATSSPRHEAHHIRRLALRASVGVGGMNITADVQAVQFMLNAWQGLAGRPFLELDGIAGPLTCGAIKELQQAADLKVTDGRVDPGGPTLELLGDLCMVGIAQAVRAAPQLPDSPGYGDVPLIEGHIMSAFWAGLASGGSKSRAS